MELTITKATKEFWGKLWLELYMLCWDYSRHLKHFIASTHEVVGSWPIERENLDFFLYKIWNGFMKWNTYDLYCDMKFVSTLGLHMSNQFFVIFSTQKNLVGGSAYYVARWAYLTKKGFSVWFPDLSSPYFGSSTLINCT